MFVYVGGTEAHNAGAVTQSHMGDYHTRTTPSIRFDFERSTGTTERKLCEEGVHFLSTFVWRRRASLRGGGTTDAEASALQTIEGVRAQGRTTTRITDAIYKSRGAIETALRTPVCLLFVLSSTTVLFRFAALAKMECVGCHHGCQILNGKVAKTIEIYSLLRFYC